MGETIKLIYHAAKVRLGFLIAACALAGFAVSPESDLTAAQLVVLFVTVLICSSGAGAFNQLWERDVDAKMKRTKERPFVTGRFVADRYWIGSIFGISGLAIVALAMATNWLAAVYLFLGAFCYGIVYTVWLKRRTWWNIVIGGLSGSFAVMAGAAAAEASLSPAPLILAFVLFLWTPPHFWALAFACKEDYAAAGIPMLPVVTTDKISVITIFGHAVVLVLLSLLPVFYGLGWIYLLGAAAGGWYFVQESYKLMQKKTKQAAWKTFAASIVQLGLLLTAAILDTLFLG